MCYLSESNLSFPLSICADPGYDILTSPVICPLIPPLLQCPQTTEQLKINMAKNKNAYRLLSVVLTDSCLLLLCCSNSEV